MCHMGLGGFNINVKTGTESSKNFLFSFLVCWIVIPFWTQLANSFLALHEYIVICDHIVELLHQFTRSLG